MGAIAESKMPKAKTITRKDDPNKVSVYAEGGKAAGKQFVAQPKRIAKKTASFR
jgi:hypothetical protein